MASNGPNSLESLFRAYGAEIRRYAQRLLGSKADAEDITQEAFLRVARVDNDQTSVALTRHYLYATTHNLAIDLFRRNQLAERAMSADWVTDQSDQEASISAERDYIAKEDLRLLAEAIESLSARRQQVFVLARLQEHSYAEIAQMLGTSVHTIKKQVAQAMNECQAYMKARGEKPTDNLSNYRRWSQQ